MTAPHLSGHTRPGSPRTRGNAGFTMVELTVALLAGLIVAMGIVGLSREATSTFHEESRASSAEAALRAAIDRLRADLQRAGYMSSGNIQLDPNIAKAPGALNVAATAPYAIANMQALYLLNGGSTTHNTLGLSADQPTALHPDLIEITGNLSTADQFDVAYVGPPGANCTKIALSPTSPAMYRLMPPGGGGIAEVINAFTPGGNAAQQFVVRLVDDTGRSQYLLTCAGIAPTLDGNNWPVISVDTQTTPIQTAQTTGTVGGLSGFAAGRAWLNPVQTVRWEITSSTAGGDGTEPAQFVAASAGLDGGTDPTKYDLMRTILAADHNVTSIKEVVAEYAIDLKFAFNIDTSPGVVAPAQPVPTIRAYAFDDATNATFADTVSTAVTSRPQRIRSVRVRLATRAAQADRTTTIAPLPALGDSYIYRYCVLPTGGSCPSPPDTVLRWARSRTLTTEVALPNQARNFY